MDNYTSSEVIKILQELDMDAADKVAEWISQLGRKDCPFAQALTSWDIGYLDPYAYED